MSLIKMLRNIWGLLLFPVLAAIWWLSQYGTEGQQTIFISVVYFYVFGAVLQVLANGIICLRHFFQKRGGNTAGD